MALLKCRECGHDVSSEAKACLNCGAKVIKVKEKKPSIWKKNLGDFELSGRGWALLLGAFGILVLLAVFGDKSGHDAQPQSTAASKPIGQSGNRTHDVLSSKSDSERNRLMTALLASESCGQVTRNFYQGMDKDKGAHWNVACSNNATYAIRINNDANGSTSVMDCSVMKAVAKVNCFEKF